MTVKSQLSCANKKADPERRCASYHDLANLVAHGHCFDQNDNGVVQPTVTDEGVLLCHTKRDATKDNELFHLLANADKDIDKIVAEKKKKPRRVLKSDGASTCRKRGTWYPRRTYPPYKSACKS